MRGGWAGCPSSGPWPVHRIEVAWGGIEHRMETIMAQIGSFTRGEDGTFTGEIRTLTLRVKAIIQPVERETDKAPDHRVSAGGVEFGAGWTKAARDSGAEYLSLKFDDPSFPAPLYATLTQADNGEHKLFWSR
jgi:uncharacterized protein (DUF736 family)